MANQIGEPRGSTLGHPLPPSPSLCGQPLSTIAAEYNSTLCSVQRLLVSGQGASSERYLFLVFTCWDSQSLLRVKASHWRAVSPNHGFLARHGVPTFKKESLKTIKKNMLISYGRLLYDGGQWVKVLDDFCFPVISNYITWAPAYFRCSNPTSLPFPGGEISSENREVLSFNCSVIR